MCHDDHPPAVHLLLAVAHLCQSAQQMSRDTATHHSMHMRHVPGLHRQRAEGGKGGPTMALTDSMLRCKLVGGGFVLPCTPVSMCRILTASW